MVLHGKNIIADSLSAKGSRSFSATNPATGQPMETVFVNPTQEEIALAFSQADAAFDLYRQLTREKRAVFLDAIANEILALGDVLIQRTVDEAGQLMVKNPYTKAVAFTGSFHGDKALFELAAAREEPIPYFAEMGSINPVFLLPGRLAKNEELIALQYVDSVNIGVG
jgi:acyl-CoA reductase-like NAD-dependent aldehyde dehydrogenase